MIDSQSEGLHEGILEKKLFVKDPLVISFYTENTPYQLEVLNLIQSCKEHNIESDIVGIACRGSWELNCAVKPFFIHEKLLEAKRPIFWVDADAVFLKKPNFQGMLSSDLSFREMKRFTHDPRFRFFSGSMFVNYTPQAISFVEKWCEYCQQKIDNKEDLQFLDQTSLIALIEKAQFVKLSALPIAYSKIFDLDAHEIAPQEVIVEHYQASRRFRFWGAK